MRTVVRVFFALLAAGALVYLVVKNQETALLDLGFWFGNVSVWMLILASVVGGAFVASVLLSFPLLRLRLRLRKQSQRVSQLEQEIHGLRTLPLADPDDVESAEAREA